MGERGGVDINRIWGVVSGGSGRGTGACGGGVDNGRCSGGGQRDKEEDGQ